MQMTLLQIVQDVLSNLSSDEVNSISDTTESMQVATIVKQTYFNILSRSHLGENKQLIQLTASGNTNFPVLMYVPDNVSKIEWVKYFDTNVNDGTGVSQFGSGSNQHGVNLDLLPPWTTTSASTNTIGLGSKTFVVASSTLPIFTNAPVIATSGANSMAGTVTSYIGTTLVLNVTKIVGSGTFSAWNINPDDGSAAIPGYKYVTILPVQQFLDMTNRFNPNEMNTQSFVFTEAGNNYTFYYKNDHQPSYCTIIANFYVIFDMYDNTQDSTLQSSKTMCMGEVIPTFTMSDTFVPPLDLHQFTLLVNEAKALAYFELKQAIHTKAEQENKRQWSALQKGKSVANKPSDFEQLTNFGRRRGTGGSTVISTTW